MSQIAVIGYGALVVAFVVTSATLVAAGVGALGGSRRYRLGAEYGAYTIFALYAVAAMAIIHAFIEHDYSLTYVYKYSDATMPWFYQLSAFWGGQAGSLMFWAATLSGFMALVTAAHRRSEAALMPWVIGVMSVVLLFFNALLILLANPFETFSLIDPPVDGNGLNPQLQTFTMLIHPPSLLTGYVACTVPFAFAMAALLSGRLDAQWLRATRKWTLIAWLFLSVGLMLGMLWAYLELGWGGYWAWDPVENAAFVPWLIMTAFLHSALIQERRGMLKRWNMALVLGGWLTTILGTYITRSGLIVSVHSFAQSEIGPYFFYFLMTAAVLCFIALAWRWERLEAENHIESPLSREAAFLLNNWLLLGAAFVVLFGTLFPKLKEMFTGRPDLFAQWLGMPLLDQVMVWTVAAGAVFCFLATALGWRQATRLRWWLLALGVTLTVAALYLGANRYGDDKPVTMREPWFNTFMTPIGVKLLLLVGVGTMISWRKATAKNFRRNFVGPLSAAVLITAGACWAYYALRLESLAPPLDAESVVYAVLVVFAGAFVTSATLLEFWRGTRVRMRKLGLGPLVALTGLVMRNQRRYGGYLVHLGMALLFLGFAGSAFRIDAKVTLNQGETVRLGDYLVTFNDVRRERDPDKEKLFVGLTLRDLDGGHIADLYPGRYSYFAQPGSPTTEVDLRSTPAEDVYFALSQLSKMPDGTHRASFMMVVSPFVFWIWVGGVLLIFGTLVAMWPQGTNPGAPTSGGGDGAGGGGGGAGARSALLILLAAGALGAAAWTPAEARADADHPAPAPAAEVESVEVLDPVTRELFALVKCECAGCGGQSIINCHLGCQEGLRDRARIEQLLARGYSRDDIADVFVDERGEGALMSPRRGSGINALAWALPLGLMAMALPLIGWFVIRSRQATEVAEAARPAPAPLPVLDDPDLSEAEVARLERLERTLEAME